MDFAIVLQILTAKRGKPGSQFARFLSVAEDCDERQDLLTSRSLV